MRKLLITPLLIACACFAGALLGTVQNQLTYTISPEWYHDWKFIQFAIPEAYHNRVGASLVGIGATWWMGVILSVPIWLVTLFAPTARDMAHVFVKVTALIVGGVIVCELGAALWGFATITAETAPDWAVQNYDTPEAAARVQRINLVGYISAAALTGAGLLWAVFQVRRLHRDGATQ